MTACAHKKKTFPMQIKIHPFIAWKVSKYGVYSGQYFPVFGLNAEIREKTPYLDTLFLASFPILLPMTIPENQCFLVFSGVIK